MIKIEQNVPMPLPRKAQGPTKYPWLEMGVGDSFFIPEGSLANMRAGASRASTVYGKKYKTRLVEGGVRVWRVK